MTPPSIAGAWAGQRNNFNLMRLVAAWMVIYGHAHAVTGIAGNDGIAWLTQLRGAGAVAVDMFFVISGFLIAASLERNSARGYLVSRGLRILPALLVCLALTTFVLGPLLTTAADYWRQPMTWNYLLVNASLLLSRFQLPGVLEGQPLEVVDGALRAVATAAKDAALAAAAALFSTLTRVRLLFLYAAIAVVPASGICSAPSARCRSPSALRNPAFTAVNASARWKLRTK